MYIGSAMCGISGLLGNADSSTALSMASCLSHRGPDGTGVFSEELSNGSIALGHARLSIIDLNGSRQPLESDHGAILIQNGEIYNYKKINSEMRNYPWRTKGDGEVILALHNSANPSVNYVTAPVSGKTQGTIRCTSNYFSPNNPANAHIHWISKLNGVWGFALWDPNKKELILSRDSMGVKPLFRTILSDGTLLFASEIKAFYQHPLFIRKPDINAIYTRLAYEYTVDRTTLFEGVSQVSPGSVETWSLDSQGRAVLTGISKFSNDIVAPESEWNPTTQSQILLDSLSSSIDDRFMSDVPIGVLLSGGLDSSLIAALSHDAALTSGTAVPECWSVAGSEDNPDFLAAELVAQHQDLKLHSSILDDDIFWKNLSNFSWHGEDLDISVLFWEPLFREMSQKVRVGLCGQGADELHAGYSRYKDIIGYSELIDKRLSLTNRELLPSIDTGPGQQWIDDKILLGGNFEDLTSTLQFEMDRGQLSNFQLRLADRHSMAFGLEMRVPFLGESHRQESHKIPINWRISDSNEKMALRKAAQLTNLPEEIINRPKLPAGTATAPNLVNSFLDELTPHATEWAKEYGLLENQLMDQPDMMIGLRLFHSLHMTERDNGHSNIDLMDLFDDVGPWQY